MLYVIVVKRISFNFASGFKYYFKLYVNYILKIHILKCSLLRDAYCGEKSCYTETQGKTELVLGNEQDKPL